MNFFRQLFGQKKEERSNDTSSWNLLQTNGFTASFVNPNMYESLSAVAGCVNLISSSLASCPAYVYEIKGNTRKENETHCLAELIRNGVNRFQSWHDYIEMVMRQLLLRGNSLSQIVYDGEGRIVELRPFPWEFCNLNVLPNGKLLYTVTDAVGMYGKPGLTQKLLEGEVLHLKDGGDLPYVGKSRISRSAAVFSSGLLIQDFVSFFYGQGIRPSGALEFPTKLDDSARSKLTNELRSYFAGPKGSGQAMILEQGAKWNPFSLNAEDAEVLNSRKFSVEEICRCFGVPPMMVGDFRQSTFTNSETAGKWLVAFCLGSWAHKIESEIRKTLFTNSERPHFELVIDLSGLTRGDYQGRWQANVAAKQAGILTANEIRAQEGGNPLEGGDSLSMEGKGNVSRNVE